MGTHVPLGGPASGPDSGSGDGSGSRLLVGLNDAQREAVVTDAAPLCILAGAGSGKTRVLTRRIAWRVSQGTALAPHVLALTFTRRAAAELRARLGQLGVREQVAAGTFHSIAYGQLRRWWADNDERPPAVLDSKTRILAKLMSRGRREDWAEPADVAAEIEWAKARLVPPTGYETAAAAAGRRPSLAPSVIAELYEGYEHEKLRQRQVDFDDLLLLCAAALEDDRRFGAAQRWRIRHLFVDEFQDVNPLQFRLLQAWRDDRPDLCVVGDPNQAIYAWNGADPTYLTDFAHRYPGAAVVRLDDNYRSSPQVLAVANAVLDRPVEAVGSPATPQGMRAHQPGGPVPTVVSHGTDEEEAAAVAAALRLRVGEVGWGQMAVLTRTHAQLPVFEKALKAAGVPLRLRGGGAFLDQPEIRSAVGEIERRPPESLLAAALPDLRELAEEAATGPGPSGPTERGAQGRAALRSGEPRARAALRSGEPRAERPYGAGSPGRAALRSGEPRAERRGRLESLHGLALEHLATDPSATCSAFLGGLRATLRGDDPDPGREAVVLATFHAAKGLEWEVVFLAGLEQGLVPIAHAETPEARAEERRLLYVAVTRARRELHASWARRRNFGTRKLSRLPSPFLEAMEAAVQDLTEGGSGDGWRTYLDDGRALIEAANRGRGRGRGLGRPRPGLAGSNADPAVLDALRTWRSRTARATGVPASLLFHDTTLAVMAEAKPRDRTALLALPGVGEVKAGRYGDDLLEVVALSAPAG